MTDPITTPQEALLPCPFCGGAAEWRFEGSPSYIVCTSCPAGETNDGERDRIRAAWNARIAAPVAVVKDEGPQKMPDRFSCHGCKHLVTEEWSEEGENDHDDSGTLAVCAKIDRRITPYYYPHESAPKWCPIPVEQPAAPVVTVKPLEWKALYKTGNRFGDIAAKTDTCLYQIRPAADGSRFRLFDPVTPYNEAPWFPTLEAAKAAAQSDYSARILSAMDMTAAPVDLDRIRVKSEAVAPLEAEVAALRAQVAALTAERDRFEAALGRACLVGGTTYLIERAEAALALVERAFKDGMSYANNVNVLDPAERQKAWEWSQVRAALAEIGGGND